MKQKRGTIQKASIIFLAAGYGWAGGHYIPPDSNFLAYGFQLAVIFLIMWLALNYERYPKSTTIFTVITLVINILNIIHGAMTKEKHSVGSHNSMADLVPILLIIVGSVLWLFTTRPDKSSTDTFKNI